MEVVLVRCACTKYHWIVHLKTINFYVTWMLPQLKSVNRNQTAKVQIPVLNLLPVSFTPPSLSFLMYRMGPKIAPLSMGFIRIKGANVYTVHKIWHILCGKWTLIIPVIALRLMFPQFLQDWVSQKHRRFLGAQEGKSGLPDPVAASDI